MFCSSAFGQVSAFVRKLNFFGTSARDQLLILQSLKRPNDGHMRDAKNLLKALDRHGISLLKDFVDRFDIVLADFSRVLPPNALVDRGSTC